MLGRLWQPHDVLVAVLADDHEPEPLVQRPGAWVVLLDGQPECAARRRRLGHQVADDPGAEAASSGRGFGLSVEQDNPRARALYERLGLVVVGEDGDELVMRLARTDLA